MPKLIQAVHEFGPRLVLGRTAQTPEIAEMIASRTSMNARLTVRTPFKKPRGGELIVEQKAFNHQLSAIRVRVEHCIGWAILATHFRCAHSIYTSVMQTICRIVNAQTQRWQSAQAANSA